MLRIEKYVNDHYWTAEGYRSSAYVEEIDDRGNAMMVVSGIAGEDKYEIIGDLIHRIRHSSPYMDKYESEALYIMGKPERALERIKTRYKPMVASELTTLWELFDEGNWSYNHGWSGGPLTMMYKYIAGIRPTAPGFRQFEVFPEPVFYNHLKCNFSTVNGDIALDYSKNESETTLKISVPIGTEALVRTPVGVEKTISNNTSSKFHQVTTGDSFDFYRLTSGEWTISYQSIQ